MTAWKRPGQQPEPGPEADADGVDGPVIQMQSISLDGGRAVPRYAFSDALELVPQRVRLTRWGTRAHG